jgi:Short C-terminal domain
MAFGRRNRPSLIETAARTAVITGTASAVSGRSARRQQAAAAAAAPVAPAPVATVAPVVAVEPAAAPAAAPAPEDVISRLERLAALHAAGALTDEEFASLKKTALS